MSDPANSGLGRPNRDYVLKALLASGFLSLAIALPLYVAAADPAAGTPVSAPTTLPEAGELPVEATLLERRGGRPAPGGRRRRGAGPAFRALYGARLAPHDRRPLVPPGPAAPRPGRRERGACWPAPGSTSRSSCGAARPARAVRLPLTGTIPKFGGAEEKEFALPAGLDAGAPVRPGDPARARGHRPAVLGLDPALRARGGRRPCLDHRHRLRGAGGDGALRAPHPPGAQGPDLPPLRVRLPAAGAVSGLLLRARASPGRCSPGRGPSPITPTTCRWR